MPERVDGEDGKIRLGLAQVMERMREFEAVGDEEVDVRPLAQQLSRRHLSELGHRLGVVVEKGEIKKGEWLKGEGRVEGMEEEC